MRPSLPAFLSFLAALLLVACSRDGAPPGTSAPPASLAAPPAAPVDFADVVRRIGLRFRPDGDAFRGAQPGYEVRVRAAETRFTPRVGRAGRRGEDLVLGPAAIARAGASPSAPAAIVAARDHAVEIDRGLAVERLENTAEGLEQSFRFAARPAGQGAVTVRVPVSGMRYAGTTAGGLHFAGAGGLGARYGAAVWIDARGARTPIAVAHEAASLVLTVPAALVEQSAYPAVLDPTLGPEIGVDNPIYAAAQGDQVVQAVSYGGGQHLVAYNDGSLWVTRVSAAGAVLDPYGILVCAEPANGWPRTAIAYDGASWLVSWIDARSGTLDLYGARVSAAGAVLDPNGARMITATSFNGRYGHSLAYGGAGYLLAYVEQGAQRGQLVSTSVQPVGTPFALTTGGLTQTTVTAAAFNGTDYLVAFDCLDGTEPAVYARRVSTAGFTIGTEIFTSAAGSKAVAPFGLASNGVDWMLGFTTATGAIRASRVTAGGVALDGATNGFSLATTSSGTTRIPVVWDGSAYQVYWDTASDVTVARVTPSATVASKVSAIIGEAGNATQPVASFDPVNGNALLAFADDRLASTFNGSDGRFTRVSAALAKLDNPSVLLTRGANRESNADVAWNGASWLVVWLDTRGADTDVYAARLDATGAMLDPAGIAVAVAAGTPARPTVASNGSGWFVAWENGSGNIVGARVSGAGAVLDATPLVIGAGTAPHVAGSTSDYAVVWHDYNTTYRVLSRRVSAAGAFLDATQVVLDATGFWPTIAWNGVSWLVPYNWAGSSNYGSVVARRLQTNGTFDPSPVFLSYAPPTGGDMAAAAIGGQWLVAWNQSTDVRAIRVSAAGAKVDTASFVVSNATNDQTVPRVAADGTNYWVAWQDTRSGIYNSDVYAARVSPAGAVLDPSGMVIANAAYDEVAPSLAGGPAGSVLVVYHHLAASPSAAAVRVFGRLLTTAAAQGTSCALGTECTSGSCVDGVCCDTACAGLCQACSTAKKGGGANGTCGPIAAGSDPDSECAATAASTCGTSGACDGAGACQRWAAGTSCGANVCAGSLVTPKLCDGAGTCASGAGTDCAPYACASGACKTSCATSADCAGSNVCVGTACVPPLSNGAACTAGAQCASGSCADGVCCNVACAALCQACSAAKKSSGADGTCGPIAAGSDPDSECAATAASTCGTSGACDGAGACALWASGTSCGASVCAGSLVTPKLCDGAGSCASGAGTDCAPYACASGACKTSCATSADCAGSNVCVGTACVPPLSNGAACTAGAQCASGSCADGVCCNVACGGTCQACSAAKKGSGTDGTCGPIAAGADPDDECAATAASTCGTSGACDGAGACALWASGTGCGANVCAGNLSTPKICNGTGACVNGIGTACAPYACASGACKNPCTASSHCVSGNVCVGGACVPPQGNGAACTAATQCASGFCVDGVCCDAACGGLCQACTIAKKGGGANGACGPIAAGSDPDSECAQQAASTCGTNGSCDGAGACQRWAAGTSCGSSVCQGNVVTGQICDGSGACATVPGGQDCAPYTCAGGACKNPCATSADCVSGHFCNAGACQLLGAPGSPCAAATECTSGFCADGVCCDAACTGACQACSAAAKGQGANGACGPVMAGSDPHDTCATSAPSTCGTTGTCDGNGACARFAAGTVCAPAACTGGVATEDRLCDGAGSCQAGASAPCGAGFHCEGIACAMDVPDGGTGGAGGSTTTTTSSSTTTSSTTSSTSSTTTTSATGGAGGHGGAGGQGGAPVADAGAGGAGGNPDAAGSCGCRAVGAEETRAPFGALALLAVLAVRRRRLSARS
jgi:hypothetical protein